MSPPTVDFALREHGGEVTPRVMQGQSREEGGGREAE